MKSRGSRHIVRQRVERRKKTAVLKEYVAAKEIAKIAVAQASSGGERYSEKSSTQKGRNLCSR